MKFDAKSIQHLSDLVRLDLSQTEVELFRGQLSSILGYIEKLQQVDVGQLPPANELPGRPHRPRPDTVKSSDQAKTIIGQAPARRDDFLTVPPVLRPPDGIPPESQPDPI